MSSVGAGRKLLTCICTSSKVEVSLKCILKSDSWCNGKRSGPVVRTLPLCHLLGVPLNCHIGLSFLIR